MDRIPTYGCHSVENRRKIMDYAQQWWKSLTPQQKVVISHPQFTGSVELAYDELQSHAEWLSHQEGTEERLLALTEAQDVWAAFMKAFNSSTTRTTTTTDE